MSHYISNDHEHDGQDYRREITKSKRRQEVATITTYAVVIVSLGLMLAFSNAFGGGYSPAVNSPEQGNPKTAAAPESTKGSVEVKLTEYKIEMPASVSAGATTFKVTNMGKETHGFEIEGNGIEKALEPTLKKGGSGSLQVDLKPGTYKVYCPVDGHKMRGMSLDLTVK
jgi:uncharacterized cupredoxin-like copper-binding protein